MTNLPPLFLARMQTLLQEEYPAFLQALQEKGDKSLRLNLKKGEQEAFFSCLGQTLSPVSWAEDGFYCAEEDGFGTHAYHHAGVYYMQEASAMATVSLAPPQKGDFVLDLCAAPGGKSTHLANYLDGTGFLVSNEIHPARSKILSQNIERMGITNAIVTNESPTRLAHAFPAFFSHVVVDAPCSGEGMFRKDAGAITQWSAENVTLCAKRQREILADAVSMVRPGGTLVYSTCTFSPEENEGVINWLLSAYPEFTLEPLPEIDGFSRGNPNWIENGNPDLEKTVRLFPHKVRGEGHFVAKLKRAGDAPRPALSATWNAPPEWARFCEFAAQIQLKYPAGYPVLRGQRLYLLPVPLDLSGLCVVRGGLELGEMRKDRFFPAHALALSLGRGDLACAIDLSAAETAAYLRGETIPAPAQEKGWCAVFTDGYCLGWGKASDGVLKNHYPKGLRRKK